jgi:hypothetical protein
MKKKKGFCSWWLTVGSGETLVRVQVVTMEDGAERDATVVVMNVLESAARLAGL